MQFKFGTPTQPGRYDCEFDGCVREFATIFIVAGRLEATTVSGNRYDQITQYLGPFPDLLPKPEFPKPFRRFNVTHRDGRIGTGAYNTCGVAYPYLIRWSGCPDHDSYKLHHIEDCTIEWIDEEPND